MKIIDKNNHTHIANITSDKKITRSELKFDLHMLTCDIYYLDEVIHQKEIIVNDYDYNMIIQKGYYIA